MIKTWLISHSLFSPQRAGALIKGACCFCCVCTFSSGVILLLQCQTGKPVQMQTYAAGTLVPCVSFFKELFWIHLGLVLKTMEDDDAHHMSLHLK